MANMRSGEGSITQWIEHIRAGDSLAAQQLWQRYYAQLVALARTKLRTAPRRVADEEDVVLCAFDSFCRGAGQGRFPRLEDRHDLWQVLMLLTARKASNQLKHERRWRRGGGRVRGESLFAGGCSEEERASLDQLMGQAPTPALAQQVAEECHRLLDRLGDPVLRQVALMKMEGYTNDEIAGRLGVKTRTIERKLQLIRQLWSQTIDQD